MAQSRVLVIGAGISGASCAGALRARGVEVTVRDRGRAPGGRLASPSVHGRRVDTGAAYVTVQDDGFGALVADWQRRGLARAWTDTLDVFAADGRTRKSGPERWAAPAGLRSLARDLHDDHVELGTAVTELPAGFDAIVLAMPDPQAARLAPDLIDWVEYEPVIAVVAGWTRRAWSFDAAFVNHDPDVALIADDGARRGDGAPVLVIHTTSERARTHLDAPDDAITPAVAAVRRLLDLDVPEWTYAHRWSFAKPTTTHGDAAFALVEGIGVCGDSWSPSGAPRVESAWLSGRALGIELAHRLG